MSSSFGSALAALKAHSTAVETVGHNLANVNTTGFKAVDVAFKDLVAENLRGGTGTGMGVAQPITVRNFTQGPDTGEQRSPACRVAGQRLLRRSG